MGAFGHLTMWPARGGVCDGEARVLRDGQAELLLAALSACMIKGIERVVPMLKFSLRGVEIRVHGVRQDVPPRMERIDYEIVVDTDEPDRHLELLHDNVKKYGTVFNTVAPGTELHGVLVRAQ